MGLTERLGTAASSIFASVLSKSWVVIMPTNRPPETTGRQSVSALRIWWTAVASGVSGDAISGLIFIISRTGVLRGHSADAQAAST